MKLFHFSLNDFGIDHNHVVAAPDIDQAVALFMAKYPGDNQWVSKRFAPPDLLMVCADVRGRHVTVDWLVEEVTGEGFLF